MRVAERHALAGEMGERYRNGTRAERRRVLDAFCLATKYHRKYAAAVLSGRQKRRPKTERRRRERHYGERFVSVLKLLWEASGYVCAERLRPWMPELARLLESHGQLVIDEPTRQLLKQASLSTVERTLHVLRCDEVGRRMVQTKPGTLLRREIPVIVGDWKELNQPGYLEVDLVSHSGEHAAGRFLYTLSAVDICTGWSERIPIMTKQQEEVERAMSRIQHLLPFTLKGIHPDNGSEFINHVLLRWCRDQGITLSRGRPYRKNDNPHVEQKNWTLVRRLIGYERLDTAEQQAWLDHLYIDLLRPFANCFQPVMKLIEKKHVGTRTRRFYDTPTTPLQRVIAIAEADCADPGRLPEGVRFRVDPDKLATLTAVYTTTSPLTLKRGIDRALAAQPIAQEGRLSA